MPLLIWYLEVYVYYLGVIPYTKLLRHSEQPRLRKGIKHFKVFLNEYYLFNFIKWATTVKRTTMRRKMRTRRRKRKKKRKWRSRRNRNQLMNLMSFESMGHIQIMLTSKKAILIDNFTGTIHWNTTTKGNYQYPINHNNHIIETHHLDNNSNNIQIYILKYSNIREY